MDGYALYHEVIVDLDGTINLLDLVLDRLGILFGGWYGAISAGKDVHRIAK
jgi:hypothetical protein